MSSFRSRRKRRIAFFDRGNASYINSDLRLLMAHCDVVRCSFHARSAFQLSIGLIKQLFHAIKIIPRSDVVFVHFAGWNSIIPLIVGRFCKKRTILFIHGTDAVSFPSIRYGNFSKQPLASVTCMSLKLARQIVAVDRSLISSVNTFATEEPIEQGIAFHCRHLRTPSIVIPHGFDPDQWPLGDSIRDIDVITVALELHQEWRRQLKGVDLLITAARMMPDRKFVVIGSGVIPDLPPNVISMAELPLEDMIKWYQRSKIYAQLSMSEGFGCALAEAMLCGCIPIVSNVGAMPAIVGEAGNVVRSRNAQELRMNLTKYLDLWQPDLKFDPRERIATNYQLKGREQRLIALLNEN